MDDLTIYTPIDLEPQRVESLQHTMAAAFAVLKAAAVEKYGFAKVKRLRDDYKAGRIDLQFNPRAKRILCEMAGLECEVVLGYIRVGTELCRSFAASSDARPGVTIGDYIQEAAQAIYDAMYTYNGENEFSTFVYWCVKNRLISFVRSEERAAKAKQRQRIDKEDVMALAVHDKPQNEYDDMRVAVAEADLDSMERELVAAHLRGDVGYRKHLTETRINPSTGRLYTRQRLSQIFVEACEKIKAAFERAKRVAA